MTFEPKPGYGDDMSTTTTNPTDSLRCDHGFPNPAACVECMEEGRFLPKTARKTSGPNAVGGYAFENDCTVQTICNAVGATYDEAATALREEGWVPGTGASVDKVERAIRALGFELRRPGLRNMIEIQRASETGRVFVVVAWIGRKGHAWAVVNGGHIDGGRYILRYSKAIAIEVLA